MIHQGGGKIPFRKLYHIYSAQPFSLSIFKPGNGDIHHWITGRLPVRFLSGFISLFDGEFSDSYPYYLLTKMIAFNSHSPL